MSTESKRFLFFGAHPDDAEELMGGTAVKLAGNGHVVKFVSMCNGDCGHFSPEYFGEEGGKKLAARRKKEAERSAAVGGVSEYEILDHHDCCIQADLATREEVVRIIRKFKPHVVITHRDCDYHADHRATGRVVMDAAYLLKVPLYCQDTPIPEINPVFAYSYDRFTDPSPFKADAVVEVDSVLETKLSMMDCHESQFLEWLPWDRTDKNFSIDKNSPEERLAYLEKEWLYANKDAADGARSLLEMSYGKEKGGKIVYAESFQLSEYGESITKEEFRKLFALADK